MNLFSFTPLECSLLIGLGAFFLIQLLYYILLYSRIARQQRAEKKGNLTYAVGYEPLSVIIAAKDMAGWLKSNLPAILEQDYPQYEVIVVNDGSVDETEEVLKRLQAKYPHLYHTFTPGNSRYVSRKKLSLTLGIRAARYDWLVFTEANCAPVSNQWLKQLARNFTPETDIVLGYANYHKGKGWFNRKIMFDRLFLSMRYLGCALLRWPYMGIGQNLAYRKSLYYQSKGYTPSLDLQRGEDDLFVNQNAHRRNTRVECSRDSVVRILPPEYARTWKEDKVGYIATSNRYKGLQRPLMAIESLSRYAFLAGCAAIWLHALYYQHWAVGIVALMMWAIRGLVQLSVFRQTSEALGEQRFGASLLLFDLCQPLWNLNARRQWFLRDKSEFMRR